jgi:hypothetical protein
MWLVGGLWLTIVMIVAAGSMAMSASPSTTALLLLACAVPPGVALLLGFGASSPTVAELLHAVNARKDS